MHRTIPEPTCYSAQCNFGPTASPKVSPDASGTGAGSEFGRCTWVYRPRQVSTGPGEEVEGHIQEALRLSPRDTRAFLWFMFVGLAKLSINADLEALDWFRRSIEANRNHALSHFHLAAALALVGDLKEARAISEAGLALDPSFTIRRYRMNANGQQSNLSR